MGEVGRMLENNYMIDTERKEGWWGGGVKNDNGMKQIVNEYYTVIFCV